MEPPVPWAIPSLEAASRGNYNQAHLRQHIEDLLAQQNANIAASSSMGYAGHSSVRLSSSSTHSIARAGQFGGAAFDGDGVEYY